MTREETTLFNFFMALIILNLLKKAIEKREIEKARKLLNYGIIYSSLCMSI